jgi:superfamily II DNA or RNA helicase
MKKIIELYDFQKESVQKVFEFAKGIFTMITGSGKTLVGGHIIKEISELNGDQFGVYVSVAPTILLNYQLAAEQQEKVFYPYKKNYLYHFVHSGEPEEDDDLDWLRYINGIEYQKYSNSTKVSPCVELIKKAMILNRPIVIYTTYRSLGKVKDACQQINVRPELLIFDEGKFAVNPKIQNETLILNPKRQYTFTPIEKYTSSNNGLGMNNTDFFGETIFSFSAKQSIEFGTMVPPKIFMVSGNKMKYNETDLDKSISKIFYDSFNQFKKYLNENLPYISPKMILPVRGIDDIVNFKNSNNYEKLIKKGVKIYMAHSKGIIGYDINGKKYSKPEFLKQLKKDGKDDQIEMIIVHYDILTRGIDVPGINAWFPFRGMNLEGSVNSMGRAGRTHETDRKRIFDEKIIKAGEYDKYVKPNFFTLFLDFTDENKDESEWYVNIIKNMTSAGLDPNDDIIDLNSPKGKKEYEQPDGTNISFNPKSTTKATIEKILLKERDLNFAFTFDNMTPLEKLIKFAPLTRS